MIAQLSQRERIFLVTGGVVLLLILLYLAVLLPYRSALSSLDRGIEARSRQLQEVKALRTRYLSMQQQIALAERQVKSSRNVSPLTVIESLVEQTAGRENLLSMRPQPPVTQGQFIRDAVEVKLEKLSLQQLLELLSGVEGVTAPMQIEKLYIKQRFDDRSLLDASMTITGLRSAT